METYGSELEFFKKHQIDFVELCSADSLSRVMVVPSFQGRVMTSTSSGLSGESYGWINRSYIESGKLSPQFNPYGGEERFWLGPEGGPFSWYFPQVSAQTYTSWKVPPCLDTEAFELVGHDSGCAVFSRRIKLRNASGRDFDMSLGRKVSLAGKDELETVLGVRLGESVRSVAYSTANSIKNEGAFTWDKTTGMPSVWLLGMFRPAPTTTVFIPFDKEFEGSKLKDDYFGKIPADRISVKDGVIYFRIDGKFRSKLGLPKGSAKDLCGSYDSASHVLNILKYTLPSGDASYVNGQWGMQEDPFNGDVINSYNDGPTETGTVMGPFYEIETSSPAAALAPGETLVHTQYTIHLEAEENLLDDIALSVFGVSLDDVKSAFERKI